MKYLTRQQMTRLDRMAIETYHIPALILMENAGRAVAQEVLRIIKQPGRAFVSVLCGPGNNGGDGLVAARHLFNQGVKVKLFYFGKISRIIDRGETGVNLRIVLKMGLPIKEAVDIPVNQILRQINKSKLIIDALFGIGLQRPLTGRLRELIEGINHLNKSVITVDVPSGLDCDKGIPWGVAVKATRTVTFGAPKLGFKKPSARKYTGKIIVADISIPHFLLGQK